MDHLGVGVGLAAVEALVIIAVLEDWAAEPWTALATWVTADVALDAGIIALRQLGEARRLRLEQAQPYVVAYMEPSAGAWWLIDLVVRNFDTTAAMTYA
jgi:hypothetical protein